jgi:hypothetical protein
MGTAIDFKKQMTEIVYINLPGPEEPTPGMSGGELLHGFLAELKKMDNPDMKAWLESLCQKWNVRYKQNQG